MTKATCGSLLANGGTDDQGVRGLAGCGPLAPSTCSALSKWFQTVLRGPWPSRDGTFLCQRCLWQEATAPGLHRAAGSQSRLWNVPSGSFRTTTKIHANVYCFHTSPAARGPPLDSPVFLRTSEVYHRCRTNSANLYVHRDKTHIKRGISSLLFLETMLWIFYE